MACIEIKRTKEFIRQCDIMFETNYPSKDWLEYKHCRLRPVGGDNDFAALYCRGDIRCTQYKDCVLYKRAWIIKIAADL